MTSPVEAMPHDGIDEFLDKIGLQQFAPGLRELGAQRVDDLQHIDASDLDTLGFKSAR